MLKTGKTECTVLYHEIEISQKRTTMMFDIVWHGVTPGDV
jgi:hypothetical protein